MGGKMIKTFGKKRQLPSSSASSLSNEELLNDIKALILEARSAVAATINDVLAGGQTHSAGNLAG